MAFYRDGLGLPPKGSSGRSSNTARSRSSSCRRPDAGALAERLAGPEPVATDRRRLGAVSIGHNVARRTRSTGDAAGRGGRGHRDRSGAGPLLGRLCRPLPRSRRAPVGSRLESPMARAGLTRMFAAPGGLPERCRAISEGGSIGGGRHDEPDPGAARPSSAPGRNWRRAWVVHRAGAPHGGAARDRFEIVAGVLSGDAARSRAGAIDIGIAADRAYTDWRALLEGERARADGADAVAVMTPNDSHHAICAAALEQGFDVICDKPLDDLAGRCGRPRAAGAGERARVLPDPQLHRLPDGPAGARHGPRRRHRRRCARSRPATSRATTPRWWKGEGSPNWRFDPAACGPSLILGDIGTHAHHLAAFVSGLELEEVMAEVWASVPGRPPTTRPAS